MNKLTSIFQHSKIKTKIIVLYIKVLLLSFLLTFTIISVVNQKYTEREIGDAGVQTINALSGNLSFIFDNVTQFSNLIYFDKDIQSSLKKIKSKSINPIIQKSITKSLVNMILSGDYLSGVYIFDKFNNVYSSYKIAPEKLNVDKVKDTKWFQSLEGARGNGFFIHKSEGIVKYRGKNNYISYIREIGDNDTYKPLATLLVTIDAKTIQSYFDEVSDVYHSKFFIVNSQNEYIIPPNEKEEVFHEFLQSHTIHADGYETVTIKDSKMILVSQDMGIKDWKLVGAFQLDDIKAMAPYYTTVILLIMILNVIFVFVCSMLLTQLIFKPLSKVEAHMKMVENGEVIEMQTDSSENEINNLKKVFNHMTISIQNLIKTVKEEEQIIAKGELDIIQAQINPHFLYNTLDAVSALVLMEDYKNCFKMMQALGSFYRNSLNSGKDFISIRDEIVCIRSYITILNIRYDDKIKVDFDVEDKLWDYEILKLLLLPPIENAVHHGIKGNEECGHIWIKIFEDDDEIIFMVSDDGIGMSEERIDDIMKEKTVTGKSGFGIHSLIQRIQLYYGIDNPVLIHSEIGSGTEITIRTRKMER